ncbi:hypothetical protein D5H75_33960 [Bailinhaonella thermotolerans]|uniref:DUF3817 domain-containing protein n=1 Tax=Bailinhaonella thermotolerans TaxID=1070861 RepID=A0A3A4AU72_9ACTN|nr:hypothetical protein D5H75_33960 [Bailinhaonella thermotolerans]
MRVLRIASAVETLSLAVLFTNLFTVHAEVITRVTGPVHGLCYVTVIGAASMIPSSPGVRLRALIPGIGGLLALRRLRSAPAPAVQKG